MAWSGHVPGPVVIGVTVGLCTLSTLVAITRLITRIKIVKKAGWDDLFISIAVVLTIAMTIDVSMQVHYGMGRHQSTLTAHEFRMFSKWLWAAVWIYYLALCFTKLSILTQYLRVIPFTQRGFRIACYILMAIIVAYSCSTFFLVVFSCWPVARFWDPSIEGTCLDLVAIWFTNSSINIATDVATAILPLPVLNTLRLPKRQKYGLMLVFALGGFTCIISAVRLYALYVVSQTRTDITWDNPLVDVWGCAEVNVGILCSCLPTLKGLINFFYPKLLPTPQSSHLPHISDKVLSTGDTPTWDRDSATNQSQDIPDFQNSDPRRWTSTSGDIAIFNATASLPPQSRDGQTQWDDRLGPASAWRHGPATSTYHMV